MWGKSFHKPCGFQGIRTSVMWDKRRGKKTPWEWRLWRGAIQKGGRQGVGWNAQENRRQHKRLQLLDIIILLQQQKKIPAMQISMHKHIHARTDNPRNADSNWSSCAFSVERESEEWYKEEFQISKTIFHFPPSAGIWDLTVLWKHSTSETYSSTNAAHMLSLSCISAPPKLKTRTNASVLYAGTQQVAG